jgi:hypothetical protein
LGLEPCNYIRGFMLSKYTKRLMKFLDYAKSIFLKLLLQN